MANLHIAGSSVLPTGGHANPTPTIVAPAMRLADHLKLRLRAMDLPDSAAVPAGDDGGR